MKFETKIAKLEITEEVESIIANCECGEITSARIVDISKLRKWELMEEIGNYLDPSQTEIEDWGEIKQLKTFCKAFEITEKELSEYYALAICEGACEIAYAINKEIVLILE